MDLTKQPPRRPTNTGMGGIAGLARMTDKARAHNAELIGEYVYGTASGLDEAVLAFIGMAEDDFADQADTLDDIALAALALERSGKSPSEIEAFSKLHVEREPEDGRHRQLLVERVAKYAPGASDIKTVYQSMELDDWGMFREMDLSAQPPRTPYLRSVAGIAAAARMADKARAVKCGKLADYKYGDDSGLDSRILEALGISAEDFLEAAYRHPNDAELGEWIAEHSPISAGLVSVLNAALARHGIHTPGYEERFANRRDEVCPGRTDVETYFDLMDIDDQQSFGVVDLRRRAPRSPYDNGLNGVFGLTRMTDKARARNAGMLGDYWYGEDSGFDRRLLEFLGLTQEEFAVGVRECPDDEAVAAWLGDRLDKPQEEIETFTTEMQLFGPTTDRQWAFLRGVIARLDPSRTDVQTFAGIVALDDKITFARLKTEV